MQESVCLSCFNIVFLVNLYFIISTTLPVSSEAEYFHNHLIQEPVSHKGSTTVYSKEDHRGKEKRSREVEQESQRRNLDDPAAPRTVH